MQYTIHELTSSLVVAFEGAVLPIYLIVERGYFDVFAVIHVYILVDSSVETCF